jgi:hypothetical protein
MEACGRQNSAVHCYKALALTSNVRLRTRRRPSVTTTPLPHATGAYGQHPRRDFNPLELLLLLRTVSSNIQTLRFKYFVGMLELTPRFFGFFAIFCYCIFWLHDYFPVSCSHILAIRR